MEVLVGKSLSSIDFYGFQQAIVDDTRAYIRKRRTSEGYLGVVSHKDMSNVPQRVVGPSWGLMVSMGRENGRLLSAFIPMFDDFNGLVLESTYQ